MEHRCEITKGLNVGNMWTPVCLGCGRDLGDWPKNEAERIARDHEQGIEQPWVIPKGERREWTPGKHPIPGFRMK